jgi:glycosyltransferase involved in cell wall biosynthesis
MVTLGTQIDSGGAGWTGERRLPRVLHVYTAHRGQGGAERFAEVTMELCRQRGLTIDSFIRASEDLPRNALGKLQAGVSALSTTASLSDFGSVVESFRPDLVHLYDHFPLITPWIAPFCAKRRIPIVLHCVHYRLTCPVATHYSHGELCTRCTGGKEYWAALRNCRQNLPESMMVALHSTVARKFEPLTKHISRFIAPSDFTRDWLAQHAGTEPSRITTVMPFVDFPDSGVDPASGEYIAFAGRFVQEKGIHTLLAAARIAGLPLRLCRNATHLVGVDLPPGVEQVVTSSRAELDAFYRGARMLIVPSEWFETFGLVGAEAMSHGVPVIAARIGALKNLVDDGVNGLFFTPGDATDLAQKMTMLWQDPALCRRLGSAAREKVADNWTVNHYFNGLMNVYGALVAA